MQKWLSNKWVSLGFFILILQILAFMTSFFLNQNAVSTWYQTLNQSPLNPPDWLFPLMWTGLYTLIAASFWLIWQNRNHPNRQDKAKPALISPALISPALISYAPQLLLNYAWSPVFFGLRAYEGAFYLSLVMLAAIGANIYFAGKVNKPAALLLIPYLSWTGFAAYLTFYVMRHN